MITTYLVLILLGIIQGISEFLPISSSGHLVIFEQSGLFADAMRAFGRSPELFINVSLHVATLIAVIIYLRSDIVKLLKGSVLGIVKRDFARGELKTALYIVAASIPAGVIGILFHDIFESLFSTAAYVFYMLIINGFILLTTKIIPVKNRKLEETGFLRALIIGCFQSLAIIPGISRSGTTITAGMLMGLIPEDSARFSFLMLIPVVSGAGLLEGMKLFSRGFPSEYVFPIIIAMAVTVIVALISLKVLFLLVRKIRIDVFGYYTILLGIAGIIFYK